LSTYQRITTIQKPVPWKANCISPTIRVRYYVDNAKKPQWSCMHLVIKLCRHTKFVKKVSRHCIEPTQQYQIQNYCTLVNVKMND